LKSARNTRRTAVAFALSTTFHVVILAFIVSQAAPQYQLPDTLPPAPAMQVQIMPMPEPPVIIVRLPPLKPPTVKPPPTPPPPKPEPPKPKPPEPAPTPPAPPTAAPAKPAPVAPKPAPTQPTIVKPLPAPTPRPETKPAPPAPAAPPNPAPPTNRAPTPPAPPAPPSPPVHLNIHKPEKEAPGGVATLPFAPAPSPAPAPSSGAPAAPSGEPPLGGSRLNGLTPYPYGTMPSGGSGLRGTLVGCANADSVNLSAAERARCNERFGSRAASAPALDSIAPAKRAAFDKAAERQDRSLRYRDTTPQPGEQVGPLSPEGTSRGPSSVIPSTPHS